MIHVGAKQNVTYDSNGDHDQIKSTQFTDSILLLQKTTTADSVSQSEFTDYGP
eukprot:CAMPEP_0119556314 /NCGR_PEP_ID=MMETSP1352-20130426/8322_1 /TAXON_ID=265584 /ORGANISM="Stauroneis constricta, Strain CCMP1120" /LENGTH=52 /DNA_ID=CAMNT_0007603257 /DNA_START=144 /DNA_END=299 /DNA_ORIENTATION=+